MHRRGRERLGVSLYTRKRARRLLCVRMQMRVNVRVHRFCVRARVCVCAVANVTRVKGRSPVGAGMLHLIRKALHRIPARDFAIG